MVELNKLYFKQYDYVDRVKMHIPNRDIVCIIIPIETKIDKYLCLKLIVKSDILNIDTVLQIYTVDKLDKIKSNEYKPDWIKNRLNETYIKEFIVSFKKLIYNKKSIKHSNIILDKFYYVEYCSSEYKTKSRVPTVRIIIPQEFFEDKCCCFEFLITKGRSSFNIDYKLNETNELDKLLSKQFKPDWLFNQIEESNIKSLLKYSELCLFE